MVGQLQIGASERVTAYGRLRSLTRLRAACGTLTTGRIPGITANRDHFHDSVHRSSNCQDLWI
jgi:aspartate ammonia-lyase